MKKLFICLALAASILFSGCGGKGVTTPIKPPVVNPVVPPVDPPVDPPIVIKRAWFGIIAVREFDSFTSGGEGLYFLKYDKPTQTLTTRADDQNISWSPNGQYLVVSKHSTTAYFPTPTILNQQGQEISNGVKDLQYNSGYYAWTPDGNSVVYGSYMDGIYALSTSGVERLVMDSWSATYDHNVFFDYDGSYMYWIHHEYGSSCTLYRVTLAQFNAGFNCSDAEKILDFSSDNHDAGIYFVPLASGKIIMTQSDKIVSIDPVAKTSTDIKSSFNFNFNQIHMSPNKQYLAVNSYDGIKILKATDFSVVKTIDLKFEDAIAWSPDSDAIVSTDTNTTYDSSYNVTKLETIVSVSWLSDNKIETINTINRTFAFKRNAYGDMYSSVSWTR